MGANAVVSLLDEEYYRQVEQIWARLEQQFGLRGVLITPFPHFTYQVADGYDFEQLEAILQNFVAKSGQAPFKVRTSGLGIFNGPQPIVYIPVVRTLELSQLHAALWLEISKTASGINPYYQNEIWLPHITLAFEDLTPQALPEVIGWLNEQNFYWEMEINNLAIIQDTGSKQILRVRYNF